MLTEKELDDAIPGLMAEVLAVFMEEFPGTTVEIINDKKNNHV